VNQADTGKKAAEARLTGKREPGASGERPERGQGRNGLEDIAQGARVNDENLPRIGRSR